METPNQATAQAATSAAASNVAASASATVSSLINNVDISSLLLTLKQRVGEGVDKLESIINNGAANGTDISSTFADPSMLMSIPSSVLEKPERMALLLLVPDMIISRYYPSSSSSFLASSKGTLFGRLLVLANAIHQISWAKSGLSDPIGAWAKCGIKLSGKNPSDQSIAWLSFLGFTITGYAAAAAGLLGPSNHILSVFALGLQKIGIVVAFLNQARVEPSLQQNAEIMALTQYNVRTGFLLIFYSLLLLWRNRKASNALPATPAYIEAMEKRLNARLDALIAQNSNNGSGASRGAGYTTPVKVEPTSTQKLR